MKSGDRVRFTTSAPNIVAPASANRTTGHEGVLMHRTHGGGWGWPASSHWIVRVGRGESVVDESMMEVIE